MLDCVLCVQDASERTFCMLFYEIQAASEAVEEQDSRDHGDQSRRAVAFWTHCSRVIVDFGIPASTTLQ